MKRVFPEYFSNFEYNIPGAAKEQEIEVYRACPTRKIERESFLNTYEENGFKVTLGNDPKDPQQYCLSTCTKLKDIKRFVVQRSGFKEPFVLAKGHTTKEDGLSCITKNWKPKHHGSHVDWWLYNNAEPWLAFEVTDYESERNNLSSR